MSQRSLKWQMVLSVCWAVVGLSWIARGLFLDGSAWTYVLGLVFLLIAAWNVVQVRKNTSAPNTYQDAPGTYQDAPGTYEGAPSTYQDAPRRDQGAPRADQG